MVISFGTFLIHVSDVIFTQFFESAHTFLRNKTYICKDILINLIRRNGYIVQKVTEINLRVVWSCIFIMRKCEMLTWCKKVIYWCILSSTCFGRICPSSGALDVKLQHTVFCTQYVDGWWSWQPLHRSCVRFGWCRATHTAPSEPHTRHI